MRPGTPGFVGARLTEAREARGLAATALADLIGVKPQMVSYYENDKNTPGPDVLKRISERLALPPRYFVQPMPLQEPPSALFFRSMSTAGSAERRRAAVQLRWLNDLSRFVLARVEVPPVNLPAIDAPTRVTEISDDYIEDVASGVRRHWGMGDGPISNVAWLLENHGVVLSRMSLGLAKLDGLSAWYDGRPHMILSSDKESAARSRFDGAHELGHVLLHRQVTQTIVNTGKLFKLIEDQAHRFAAAFLFPAKAFALEVHPISLEHFVELKQRWKVSIALMIQRAETLGILGEHEGALMWRRLNFKRWRAQEPLDGSLSVERPRMLQRALDMLLRSGKCAREDLLFDVPVAPQDIERLAGLPVGYLSDTKADVVDIQPRLRSNVTDSGKPEGHVIPFRKSE